MMLSATLVVSFCKDWGGGVSVNVNLWFLVVCVRCDVLCHFVVAGNMFLLVLIVVIFMRGDLGVLVCVVCFISGLVMNTNNTSNYQSTNEIHYTQENTTITTHKRSQLLILTETRYQLQQSDKEHHTEHTPLRTINLHYR